MVASTLPQLFPVEPKKYVEQCLNVCEMKKNSAFKLKKYLDYEKKDLHIYSKITTIKVAHIIYPLLLKEESSSNVLIKHSEQTTLGQ